MDIENIRTELEKSLADCFEDTSLWGELATSASEVFNEIRHFVLSPGKRLRPALFLASYQGYALSPADDINKAAIALELLHNFVLIHDDVIDKSGFRRSQPSLHRVLDHHSGNPDRIFSGEDLALVAGDIIYALALRLFLDVSLKSELKEAGLRCLTETAIMTGQGEILELLETRKTLAACDENRLFRIYDLKTALYTFCCPLKLGALLAGRIEEEAKLHELGLILGRAYQILDDLGEILAEDPEESRGWRDLVEKKHTILLYWAYQESANKSKIDVFLNEPKPNEDHLEQIRRVILDSKAIEKAKSKIASLRDEASLIIKDLQLKNESKVAISKYCFNMLKF